VTPSADAQPFGVGDAFGGQQVDPREDVGPFGAADVARDGRREVVAAS
jgi:hypothetical protein